MTRPAPTTVDAALVQLDEMGWNFSTCYRDTGFDLDWCVAAMCSRAGGLHAEARHADLLTAYRALVVAAAEKTAVPSLKNGGPIWPGNPVRYEGEPVRDINGDLWVADGDRWVRA